MISPRRPVESCCYLSRTVPDESQEHLTLPSQVRPLMASGSAAAAAGVHPPAVSRGEAPHQQISDDRTDNFQSLKLQ